jgi:hypothetical protein
MSILYYMLNSIINNQIAYVLFDKGNPPQTIVALKSIVTIILLLIIASIVLKTLFTIISKGSHYISDENDERDNNIKIFVLNPLGRFIVFLMVVITLPFIIKFLVGLTQNPTLIGITDEILSLLPFL